MATVPAKPVKPWGKATGSTEGRLWRPAAGGGLVAPEMPDPRPLRPHPRRRRDPGGGEPAGRDRRGRVREAGGPKHHRGKADCSWTIRAGESNRTVGGTVRLRPRNSSLARLGADVLSADGYVAGERAERAMAGRGVQDRILPINTRYSRQSASSLLFTSSEGCSRKSLITTFHYASPRWPRQFSDVAIWPRILFPEIELTLPAVQTRKLRRPRR